MQRDLNLVMQWVIYLVTESLLLTVNNGNIKERQQVIYLISRISETILQSKKNYMMFFFLSTTN